MRAANGMAYRLYFYAVLITGSWAFSHKDRMHLHASTITQASEGSLNSMQVASSMAEKPGETAAFYNPYRRVGRDCSVLSVAQWIIHKQQTSKSDKELPIQILDAHSASGMAGLRVAVESPILARTYLNATGDSTKDSQLPPLAMTINDVDPKAAQIATHNAELASQLIRQPVSVSSSLNTISVSNRDSQSLWHESSFDVSLIDPFGCTTAYLDSALAKAPQGGLLDICATDVTALYGGRPAMATRHYGGYYQTSRPPCYKERGVRMLLAAVAQAAGRQDRGIRPLYSLSTAHYVVVAVQVVRRGQTKTTFGPDATIGQVQSFPICRSCGAPGNIENSGDKESTSAIAPDCLCDASETGAGTSAICEGPLWRGPLHDSVHLEGMMRMACLPEAQGWISPETKAILQIMCNEALVEAVDCTSSKTMFHRRPSFAAPTRVPPLGAITEELQRRGFQACRTQFDNQALKSNASPSEFDDVVRSLDRRIKFLT